MAGLAGDRRWAFIRPGLERSAFPWLTIREQPELRHHVPRFADPERPDASPTLVRTPAGEELDVADPALAAALGEGVRRDQAEPRRVRLAAASLITTGQHRRASARSSARELEVQRFRPNLLVEPAAGGRFPEDGWVGRTLRIGGLRMRVDERDARCVMVNVDPETDERDHAILRRSPASARPASASTARPCSPAAWPSATRSSSRTSTSSAAAARARSGRRAPRATR